MSEDFIGKLIEKEKAQGLSKFGKFMSRHELYAVLLEEVEEFWEVIRKNKPNLDAIAELIQIAAVAKRGAEELQEQEQSKFKEGL